MRTARNAESTEGVDMSEGTAVLVVGRGGHVVTAVVAALADHGITAVGATTDADALARLDEGGLTALVVGAGVERRSRAALQRRADATGVTFVQGALRGRELRSYVRDELVPALSRG